MKMIIPMAGLGKRMRPHTLTTPKPLIHVAGKPIVQRLVEDIAEMCKEDFDEIAFVIGDFGKDVEATLMKVAERIGAKGRIFYQDKPLGTAHAILCAKDCLKGPVIVAFADTLFYADFKLDKSKDGIIWVHEIEDPRAFGVVKVNKKGIITDFVEKPVTPVSNLAIIGVYYFKDGERLHKEMQYLIDNDIKDKGEYQLTNAMENMKQKGAEFIPGKVNEWLDCGNKDATVFTNERVLEHCKKQKLIHASATIENSSIIAPCYIGPNASIKNSVIGPYSSIGADCVIDMSIIQRSIVQNNSRIHNRNIRNSMIGNHANLRGKADELSIGDYSTGA